MEELKLIEYHQDLLTGPDKEAVETWLAERPENKAIYAQNVQIWLHSASAGALDGLNQEADLAEVHTRFGEAPPTQARSRGQLYLYWRIAAVLLLAVGLSWGSYKLLGPAAAPQMLALETGENPGDLFALSDGSQVRLNAHSTLRYPAQFTGDRRELELTGEAWFSVAPDKAHPFVIQHGKSSTEVLGTQFDVRAYPDEPTVQVTVFEGLVRLSAATDSRQSITLRGGETGQFRTDLAQVAREDIPDLNQDAWRSGVLEFDDTPLKRVFSTLEKHFRVKIQVKDSKNYQKCRFTGKFSETTIHPILDALTAVFGAGYTSEGNEITILGANC